MVVKPNFWKGKRVLLTGHTGFKGSWLSLWLQELGSELTGFALSPPTQPSLFQSAEVSKGMKSVIGDIRDYRSLEKALIDSKPEIIIHMAAQPLVRYSYQNPVETYATNVMGTVHLLESVRQIDGVRAIVNVTTDKCYENKEWVWGYREEEPMGGHDPYSSSKGCSELVTSAYRRSYFESTGTGLASARAGNVIGGGDWAGDRLVPDILRAFERHQPVIIRNPHSIRPWQHVLEPLSGYMSLAERLWNDPIAFAEGWNFGPRDEDAKPVGWIVESLVNLWGDKAGWRIESSEHQPHEANYLKLDISKARQRLGWEPRWPLQTALKKIVSWQKDYLAGKNLRSKTLDQISEFKN